MTDRLRLDVWRPLFTWLETGDDSVFPHFHGKAKCTGLPPERYFPANSAAVRRAKVFCNGSPSSDRLDAQTAVCPVRDECLEYAVSNYLLGVWGGTSERDRRVIRRERKAAELKRQRMEAGRQRKLALARKRRAAAKPPVKKRIVAKKVVPKTPIDRYIAKSA